MRLYGFWNAFFFIGWFILVIELRVAVPRRGSSLECQMRFIVLIGHRCYQILVALHLWCRERRTASMILIGLWSDGLKSIWKWLVLELGHRCNGTGHQLNVIDFLFNLLSVVPRLFLVVNQPDFGRVVVSVQREQNWIILIQFNIDIFLWFWFAFDAVHVRGQFAARNGL